MRSVIQIDFTGAIPAINDFINLFSPQLFGLNGLTTFNFQRLRPTESTRVSGDAIQTAANYALAFNLDYNASGVFLVTVDGAIVTIKVDQSNAFDGFTKSAAWTPTVTITTENIDTDLELTDVQYFEDTGSPCDNVKVVLTFNKTNVDLTLPVVDSDPNGVIEFVYPRGINYPIEANVGADVFTSSQNLNKTPAKLLAANISTRTTATPSGATLVVSYLGSDFLLALEYSLDGITYQTSNVFGGLPDADYDVYIRDQYGCSVSKTITIGDLVIGESQVPDYFYLSEANPFIFANDNGTGLNSKLSFNERTDVNYSALHIATDTDSPTVQFKTNLNNVTVDILNCDGDSVNSLTVVKKTANINYFDKRDAVKYTVEDRGLKYINIYFEGGNTYDVLNAITGTYTDTKSIPVGYDEGQFVVFDGGTEVILKQVYNQTFNRFEIRTSLVSGVDVLPTPIQISTYYNIQDYDVYEATTDFTALDGYYQIKIDAKKEDLTQFATYLSESILIAHQEDLPSHHLVEYSGTRNSDLLFSRGLRNIIRVPYDITPTIEMSGEIETYQTDTKLVSIETRNYDNRVFNFGAGENPLTTQQIKWLSLILSHDVIFIDNDNYLKKEQGESSRIGSSNAYRFIQLMQREFIFSSIEGLYNTENAIDTININTPTYAYVITGNSLIDSNGLVVNGN
tara:strand:- start:511 stop:2556 length:2046 start_codon:yes stop_codon:yes gene_type:complete